jgi:MFS transporter, DHA2 family, multidrug resistance protein
MAAPSEEHVSLRTWIAVLGTVLGAFMAVLDIQITNASLREITGGIASTAVEASWVSTSYLIGEIIRFRSQPGWGAFSVHVSIF